MGDGEAPAPILIHELRAARMLISEAGTLRSALVERKTLQVLRRLRRRDLAVAQAEKELEKGEIDEAARDARVRMIRSLFYEDLSDIRRNVKYKEKWGQPAMKSEADVEHMVSLIFVLFFLQIIEIY